MTSKDINDIILLIFLILLSGFFSSSETAFSALNPIKLKHLAEKGNKKAARTLKLNGQYEELITSILIGNNITNILSTIFATVFFVRNFGNIGVLLSTVVMTVLILIFGEITPKISAKKVPEKFALFVTPFLIALKLILHPLVLLFRLWQNLLTKIFKFKEETVTEDELLTIVKEAEIEGSINKNESALIKSVFDFDELLVDDIYTARVNMISLELNSTNEDVLKAFRSSGYSRIPIYENNVDKIIGIINHKNFYNDVIVDKKDLGNAISSPIFVTNYMKVSSLLNLLKQEKEHMAIVKDEFGGTLGLVTLEDILEELVGDIWDEHDYVDEKYKKLNDGSYIAKGDIELDDLFKLLNIELDEEATTLNGFIQDKIGSIPIAGDNFVEEGYKFIVLSADNKKVIEVKIEKTL